MLTVFSAFHWRWPVIQFELNVTRDKILFATKMEINLNRTEQNETSNRQQVPIIHCIYLEIKGWYSRDKKIIFITWLISFFSFVLFNISHVCKSLINFNKQFNKNQLRYFFTQTSSTSIFQWFLVEPLHIYKFVLAIT